MDDAQTAFASQYPSYAFDIDMMKVCGRDCPELNCQLIVPSSALWNPLADLMLKRLVGHLPRLSLARTMDLLSKITRLEMLLPTTATAPRLA